LKRKKESKPDVMQVPAGQALQALQALQKLANCDIPAMEAFELSRMLAVLTTDPGVVATDKTRFALVKKHGVEKNGGFSVPPENAAAFMAEYQPVATAIIELRAAPLPASILEHAVKSAPAMSAMDMMALQPFFRGE
jgi:hypothetical protein